MSKQESPVEAKTRRHVIRIAAMLSASTAFGLATTKKSRAAGRHSDPFFCEPGPVCLLRGSRIETAKGEVAIEDLKIGDLIRTAEGKLQQVRWIGRRLYTKAPEDVWPDEIDPVMVKASAVAAGVPSRDLYLSPKHALFLDGYLIPVMFLINGVTIRQRAFDSDAVEYFHVECEAHEVMFAEGLAVETFRLQDSYDGFANSADHERRFGSNLHPVEPYAPVLGYWSLGQDVVALLRSLGSAWVDLRDPIQVIHDRIAARASEMV